MIIDLDNNLDKYIQLHADCIPVKGAARSAIYDLTRNEIILFPTYYYEMLDYLSGKKVKNLLNETDEEQKAQFIDFINFLDNNELIIFLEDPSLFPSIQELWDAPGMIQNAIIDIDSIHHNFDKIFNELNDLGCQYVQIRCFSNLLKLQDIDQLLTHSYHKSICSVELILKYDAAISDNDYVKLVETQPIISSLVIHSAPNENIVIVDYGCDEETNTYIKKEICFTDQIIDSEKHCGIINTSNLCAPTITNFFENKLYNGCHNRKISVDKNGEIKNCPSMHTSYGNIKDISLDVTINNTEFVKQWNITKDQIKICKDCEFRYACTDCRAYTENYADQYSKPLKCGYNPYINEWEKWSENPLKISAINYYGLNNLSEI